MTDREEQVKRIMMNHDHYELANQMVSIATALDVEIPFDDVLFEMINNILFKTRHNKTDARKMRKLKSAIGAVMS